MILLTCELWVSSFLLLSPGPPAHYATGQMGICFAVDQVAPGYVVNVDGRGWEPVDKFKCTKDSVAGNRGEGYQFTCYARYKFVYYGIDRTMQLARADNLNIKTERAANSRVIKEEIPGYATDDARYPKTQEPITPGFNSWIDEEGQQPTAPAHPRVVQP